MLSCAGEFIVGLQVYENLVSRMMNGAAIPPSIAAASAPGGDGNLTADAVEEILTTYLERVRHM